jgi:hypothetical protein
MTLTAFATEAAAGRKDKPVSDSFPALSAKTIPL